MPPTSSSSSSSSSSGSSTSSDSTSSSSSSTTSSKGKKARKFIYSKKQSSSLTKWIITGIDEKTAKNARELFRPRPKGKAEFLVNPTLDEGFYQQLKTARGSSASKPNVDPLEKIYRAQTYKLIDLARPLMFLMSRSKQRVRTKSDSRAIHAALVLWARLFGDILGSRRRNILSQIYPNNIGLLDDKKILSAGGDHLFGPEFVKALVTQIQTLNALGPAPGASTNRSTSSGGGNSSRQSSQQRPSQSSQNSNRQHSSSGYNNNGYVLAVPAFNNTFGGRISIHSSEWALLSQDRWVLATVASGFLIDFISPPSQSRFPPNATMNCAQRALVDLSVSALLQKGVVVETTAPGFLSGIFLIPKKIPGEWRPIINLKALNQFIVHRHFKMEGIITVRHSVRQGDWLAKLDIQDAYFTVPIRPIQTDFLQFRWRDKNYKFLCLLFGLSSAPWAFTKILRVVVAFLRRRGIRLVIYLDDILLIGTTREETSLAVQQVKDLLESLGFIISATNSIQIPTQSLEYLGLVIDTLSMRFSLSDRKRAHILRLSRAALDANSVSLRQLATLLGLYSWAVAAVDYAQAHFRALQALYIKELHRADYNLDASVSLASTERTDLMWWLGDADFGVGGRLLFPRPDVVIASDASLSGWGAVCQGVRTNGPWTLVESTQHINALELLAALRTLQCFTPRLRDAAVEIFVDNTSAVAYINKSGGSHSRSLCSAALLISEWCESHRLSVHAVYLPSKENYIADAESRKPMSSGDWKLCPKAFQSIHQFWPLEVDLFASLWNAQLPRFLSWFPQPGSSGVDAFSIPWTGLRSYSFPPFSLIPFCLSKLILDQAETVLVTPYWPSQSWFPSLMSMAIDVPLLLLPGPYLLTSPMGVCHPLLMADSMRLIAWKLSGVVSVAKAFRQLLLSSCWVQLEPIHTLHTSPPGSLGEIGVCSGIVIPCRLAFQTSSSSLPTIPVPVRATAPLTSLVLCSLLPYP